MTTIAQVMTEVGRVADRYTTVYPADGRLTPILNTLFGCELPGLLLKKIDTIEEAFAIGGLAIVAPDGNVYFWVGTDLARAINDKSLATVFSTQAAQSGTSTGMNFRWENLPRHRASLIQRSTTAHPTEYNRIFTGMGGYMNIGGTDTSLEAMYPTGSLYVCAVVTSATCGVGRSDGLSVLTTLKAMNNPFGDFMKATKAQMFEGIDNAKIRAIAEVEWTKLYDELGPRRPTIDAYTSWVGTVRVQKRVQAIKSTVKLAPGGASYEAGFSFSDMGFSAFNVNIHAQGAWGWSSDYRLAPEMGTPTVTEDIISPGIVIRRGHGFKGYTSASTRSNNWALIDPSNVGPLSDPAKADVGNAGGFNIGLLRNGHILRESQAVANALDLSAGVSPWSLKEYVDSFLDNEIADNFTEKELADSENASAILEQVTMVGTGDGAQRLTARGTLHPTLRYLCDEFARRIKVEAKKQL